MMLLEFRMKNYKSFRGEAVLSMRPAPKQRVMGYSLLSERVGTVTYKALCSSAIYGPNAAGKTNIVGALETFRGIVLRGNVLDAERIVSPNAAAYKLALIPNKDAENEPVSFSVSFVDSGFYVRYGFTVRLGNFGDVSADRVVTEETLDVNDIRIFTRSGQAVSLLNYGELKRLRGKNAAAVRSLWEINDTYPLEAVLQAASRNLEKSDLFLMNGFKTLISPRVTQLVTDWLQKKLIVIYRANEAHIMPVVQRLERGAFYRDQTVENAAKEFGINSNGLIYAKQENGEGMELVSVIERKEQPPVALPAQFYESYGTISFVNIFPLLLIAMHNGATLVVDEFGSSIHPMAIMNIITIFHNDDINKRGAQLIFNTQNPIFLNNNLLRRDEIKFVERDDKTHESTLYALSDFGTAGAKGVRRSEDYMANYFVDRYGAIRDVDFSSFFSESEGGTSRE